MTTRQALSSENKEESRQPTECALCPRNCGARRWERRLGYCRTGTGLYVAAICAHRGEEPVISGPRGICNVFFAHCNMQCVYCQNYQISRNTTDIEQYRLGIPEAADQIRAILAQEIRSVGFISPSHCIPQMKAIIRALEKTEVRPVFVMNTNGYDRAETIRSLDGVIDVYLPDLKYMDSKLAERYSGAPDYPLVATAAIKEMFCQKGSKITLNGDGTIESGLIIRHLVLPGLIENSKRCLEFIAHELSPEVHVSVMSQYAPIPLTTGYPELNRFLTKEEYKEVLATMEKLGLSNGWQQDMESRACYFPDFSGGPIFRQP